MDAMRFSELVESKSWEHTQDEEIELGMRIGGPEGASDARKRWPREFIMAAKARKAIPLNVLLDGATKSAITLATEDGTFTENDLKYLCMLAASEPTSTQNPTIIPLYLWATASFLSFLSSLISIFNSGKIPLVAEGTAANPRKARSKIGDRGREGCILTASFIISRQQGRSWLARAVQDRVKALFPRTWKAVLTQLGDLDDPETGKMVVAEAHAVIGAASVDELKTVLPRWIPVWTTKPGPQWMLLNIEGEEFRQRMKDGMWMITMFKSPEEALAFVKSSKGKKAVAAFRRMLKRDEGS